MSSIINKVWGTEEVLVNDEEGNYCMKRMRLLPRTRCSLHHHDVKHETFVVESGRLHLQLGDGLKNRIILTLRPGQQQVIVPGMKHLFWSHVPTVFTEVSTFDRPSDSIRTDQSTAELGVGFCSRWPFWPGNLNFLVIGDVMLDEYQMCAPKGVSIEDSRRVDWKREGDRMMLGGAGNVAVRLLEMGGQVRLAGVVGGDSAGMLVQALTNKRYGDNTMDTWLVTDPTGITTHKKRYAAHDGQVIFRTDADRSPQNVAPGVTKALCDEVPSDSFDVAMVADHAKGVVTNELLKVLRDNCGLVCIDPSPDRMRDFGDWSLKVDVVKCNEREFHARSRRMALADAKEPAAALEVWRQMRGDRERDFTLVCTRGGRGAWVVTNRIKGVADFYEVNVPSEKRGRVIDVTGAGDEFMVALCVELGLGIDPLWASQLAVAHASEMVQHPRALT